jgi:hypothetical protein
MVAALIFMVLPTAVLAQGLPIKDGNSSTLAEVNTAGSIEVVDGKSIRPTYIASSSALVTTAAYNISIESSAGTGFKLVSFCVGWTSATTAAGVTIAINRRTTASSGGAVMTAEGTGADSISKMDPADGNFGGIARRTGTLGTIGATLFQTSVMVGEIAAGTADVQGGGPFCKDFGGVTGEKPIVVASGVTNGISITVTSLGAGGLSFGSISAVIIAE